MKILYFSILAIIIACSRDDNKTNLEITKNVDVANFWHDSDSIIIEILENSDFAVIFHERSQLFGPYYIFRLTRSKTELIYYDLKSKEYSGGDSITDIGNKYVVIKTISPLNSYKFIEELKKYRAFDLKEQKELLENCKSIIGFDHPPVSILTVYKKGSLREIYYRDVNRRMKDCSGQSDWRRMAKIKNLFEEQWSEGSI